jgi:hypothetical protein
MAAPEAPPLVGRDRPRIAPPLPARSQVKDLEAAATDIGITLLPWQRCVGRYLYAVGPKDQWLYPEVAAVVSRQNGKTEILVPHVMRRLAMGRRILHAAQTRELPRLIFNRLAQLVEARYPDAKIRRGAGQETIELANGGFYKITAATGGGPRGTSIDDLIPDELRELEEEFIGAALPTMTSSLNPQVFYLSNAGTNDSRALNAVRSRSGEDPSLAYLEWSAAPDRPADDRAGWAEANPSLGHFPMLLPNLERLYRSHALAGTLGVFETEHLCRWVDHDRAVLVNAFSWSQCENDAGAAMRPAMGISMDPGGRRAYAAIAWPRPDGTVGLREVVNAVGSPIDIDKLGKRLRADARALGVTGVGFDPLTDAQLAKYLRRKPEPIIGQKYANASARFVSAVESKRLVWSDCAAIGDDLTWTARKPHDETGSFQAVRAQDDRPIPASLAAIRAVWLASAPRPEPVRSRPAAMGF